MSVKLRQCYMQKKTTEYQIKSTKVSTIQKDSDQ